MSYPLNDELQKILIDWQYFAPCLGANLTVYDSKYGYLNFSSGYASINPEKVLSEESQCYIYSITKTFTAILLMQLFEKGQVSLDDPIVKYFPDILLPKSVTIKHLLNHNSGVPSYTDLPDYMSATRENPSVPWSFEEVIERTCKTVELDFNPEEKWHYSNTGYMLLLLLIERVSGDSFSDNVDQHIVQRIALENTYVAEDVDNGKLTAGYNRYMNNGVMKSITHKYNPWWCKTGLIVSTTKEITRLYHALFAGKLVNKGSLKEMINAISIMTDAGPHFKKPSYGFGLMIDPENQYGCSYGHGGDGPGFNTWSVFYPEFNGDQREVGVTVFCNTSMGGHPFCLVNEILNALKKV